MAAKLMRDETMAPEQLGPLHEWLKGDLSPWVQNAKAQLEWVSKALTLEDSGELLIPLTLYTPTLDHAPGTYITSLKCGWFDYLAEELHERQVLAWLIKRLGSLAKNLGLEDLILIGNLPVSTNLHDLESLSGLAQLARHLRTRYPNHFMAVRNLIPSQHASTLEALKAIGFFAIPQRVVYHFDLRLPITGKKPSHLQRDLTLLKNSGLKVQVHQSITRETSRLICLQYQQIYIDKHSAFNANYTADFFYDSTQSGAFQCMTLSDAQENILAFAMLYTMGQTLSVPALGYETQSSMTGLYRMLFASIWLHTQNSKMSLNYSSGAGDFKRKRGGLAELEYTLIAPPKSLLNYKSHLLEWLQNITSQVTAQDLIRHGA